MDFEQDQTVDFVPSSQRDVVAKNVSSRNKVAINFADSNDLSQRFRLSTRKLLHHRLFVAAATLLSMMVTFKLLVILAGQLTTEQFFARILSIIVLTAMLILLRAKNDLPLRTLRLLEILILAVLMFEAVAVQFIETRAMMAANDYASIPTLHALLGTAVAIFIAIYGMFIPSDWRRTALITIPMALLPTIAAWTQVQLEPELQGQGIPQLIIPLLLFMMAIVSTVGASVVHNIRKEVESARQYGQYQLLEEIGRGGMGVVYKAQHRLLKRPAAIKLIIDDDSHDEQTLKRFESEVQLSATLSHWNTVQIYDYGRTARGEFYYVMEHLIGKTLADKVKEFGKLEVSETIDIANQICDGLAEAHQQGMVHRDIKPANIFLAQTGGKREVVKILDFGLATIPRNDPSDSKRICGTAPYMSPEQIRGEPIDPRSDIFAIGCLIYECIHGTPLFQGNSLSEIMDDHDQSNKRIANLSINCSELQDVVSCCVSLNPQSRIGSAEELQAKLNSIRSNNSTAGAF